MLKHLHDSEKAKMATPSLQLGVLVVHLPFFSWLGDTRTATREIHEWVCCMHLGGRGGGQFEVGSVMKKTGIGTHKKRM